MTATSDHLDHTHDPAVRSWVDSANALDSDFPLQNLPLCVFHRLDDAATASIGIGIGDKVFDVRSALPLFGNLPGELTQALQAPRLNVLFALGRPALQALRCAAWRLLAVDTAADRGAVAAALVPQASVRLELPCDIGDYTDFFASPHHARNTFDLFRPGQVFLPNFAHLPIAYHGRASSIVASGQPLRRPWGQLRPDPLQSPEVAPSRKLDIEVELGFYVSTGNALGDAVALDAAELHLAGVSLLNDWSARDVQAFESQPLGPFQSKNFCSSVAPWVVTLDALAPFRTALLPREADAPPLHGYLDSGANTRAGAFDIRLETSLQTAAMRSRGEAPVRISEAAFAQAVCWTPAQMLAHHTLGGCNLRPGDLLGSGTISGADRRTQAGSLLELTLNGTQPLTLPDGDTRSFLEDGDEVTLVAWCERPGFRRIGFGRCTTRVLAAHAHSPAPALSDSSPSKETSDESHS